MRHIYVALSVSSDTLKGIVRNHLPQQYQFSRKEIGIDSPCELIGIDSSCDCFKLFTTIPKACRFILRSAHHEKYDVLDFLVERQNHL